MRTTHLFALIFAFMVIVAATAATAAAPSLVSFQGRLKDSGGALVADAGYSVVFTIYDAATAGTPVWTEAQPVNTSSGHFAVLLGAVNPIPDSVFNGTTRYLGIAVAGDPEIAPRTAMVSVPYAQRVSTIDGAAGGAITTKVSIGPGNTNAGTEAFVAGSGNDADGNYATISGGTQNTASAHSTTVAGGNTNTASGDWSTVGGGSGNVASADVSTVSGGGYNTAGSIFSTVGGGSNNIASGYGATVSGGYYNTASGLYSVASGYNAKAMHDGAFVWGDYTILDVSSSAANQFTARTSGGARFFSDAGLTTGVTMAPGGGSWASVSDRNLKSNFEAVDPEDVLARVAAMPMTTWNYNSQEESIRHMGPMAQDFRAAFGLGEDDTHITTIDADGVALAAIQGLNLKMEAKLKQKDEEIAALRQELAGVKELVAGLADRLPQSADAQLGMK